MGRIDTDTLADACGMVIVFWLAAYFAGAGDTEHTMICCTLLLMFKLNMVERGNGKRK